MIDDAWHTAHTDEERVAALVALDYRRELVERLIHLRVAEAQLRMAEAELVRAERELAQERAGDSAAAGEGDDVAGAGSAEVPTSEAALPLDLMISELRASRRGEENDA